MVSKPARGAAGLVGFALGVVLLLLVPTGSAQAGPQFQHINVQGPYGPYDASPWIQVITPSGVNGTSCGTGSSAWAPRHPNESLRFGTGWASLYASLANCPTSGGDAMVNAVVGMSHITFKAPATIKHYITLRWKLTYDVRLAVALNGTPANSTGDGGPPSWDCVADATAGAHTVVGSYHHGAGQVGGTLQRVSNGSLNLTDVTQNYTDRFEMNMTKGEVIELWEYVEVSVGCESYYGATGDRFSAFLDVSGRNGTGAAFLGITD